MTQIKKVKTLEGVQFYPQTHTKAVIDDNGNSVENLIEGLQETLDVVTPTISQNGKWVIGGIETNTDAQGPKGDSILVNEESQSIQGLIVNNVVNGGETSILSAEMGKVIRLNIMRLYNSLGMYAFPNGKPILTWGSTAILHSIDVSRISENITITDILVNGDSAVSLPQQIADNASLSFKVNLSNNLYVFGDVSIKMGGIDITDDSGVWDESSSVISISNVTGDIVITVPTITYVQDHLEFNLDCRQGVTKVENTLSKWTDVTGGVEFTLTDVTQDTDDSLVFNGITSKGVASGGLNIAYDSCTVEVVAELASFPAVAGELQPILSNTVEGSAAAVAKAYQGERYLLKYISCSTTNYNVVEPKNMAFWFENTNVVFSSSKDTVFINGIEQDNPRNHAFSSTYIVDVNDFKAGLSDVFAVGYSSESGTDYYLHGTIKAIRVYSKKLSEQEMQSNYAIDNKRFNLS